MNVEIPLAMDALPRESTVSSLIEQHLRVTDGLTLDTRRLRTRRLREFARFVGDKPINECRAFDLAAWLNSKPWSDWTKRGACLIVKTCFNWGVKMGLIEVNPFARVSYPQGKDRRDMTQKEFEALLAVSGEPFRRVLRFLWYTGVRPCELRRLQWRHLNFDADPPLVVFPAEEHKTGKKTRRPRIVPLTPEAVQIIDVLEKKARPGQTHVFINQRGKPCTKRALEEMMRRLRKKARLPQDVTLYCSRHAMGTRLAEAGYGSPIISAVLGHTSSAMSDRYTHLHGKHQILADAMSTAAAGRRPA